MSEISPKLVVPQVHYHALRQSIFEHALMLMESVMGRKGSLIDLGAGHCGFSLMAHAMGWDVTAFDARSTRVPDLPDGIRFILGDVDSDKWSAADYDLILCLGLYYHLDQDMQHRLLRKCRSRPLIIDTHIANLHGQPTRYHRALGATHEKNGEIGGDYRENPHLDDATRKASSPLASMENPSSWWQTKDSLLKTLHDFGWPHVWTLDYPGLDFIQRTFFICYTADESSKGVSGIRF